MALPDRIEPIFQMVATMRVRMDELIKHIESIKTPSFQQNLLIAFSASFSTVLLFGVMQYLLHRLGIRN